MTGVDPLQHLTEQLEQAAAQLRSGELEPQQAARLVEDCARLAGEAATELDRRVRAAADAPAPAQPAAPVVPPPAP
jgi:polyhydroxyalkanoate synthesis regulator phasin